jgi:hypothetical protein
MTVLHPGGGRHARRRTRSLIFWLTLADAALFALCVIAGGIRGLGGRG